MTKAEAKKRIEVLRKTINHHRYLYHVLDRQEIDDAAFDSLKHELWQLEQQFPDLITPDSPSQRVGGQPLDKFEKVRHQVPMLSLEDVFSAEELGQWRDRIQKLVPASFSVLSVPQGNKEEKQRGRGLDYFAELKIDGFAVTLIYERGIFKTGATRGNGRLGEDVTQNLKTIESIPLRLRQPTEKEIKSLGTHRAAFLQKRLSQSLSNRFEVRGEVVMTKEVFKKINQERAKKGEPLYANPRNTAAGSIRQLDPKIAASRRLDFLAYDIITDFGQEAHSQEHALLPLLGFKTDKYYQLCPDLAGVNQFHQKMQRLREKLPYQIDGLVVTVNQNHIFEKLGVVGKAPRGGIAYKFPGKQAATIIQDIKVQVGRTGALTPVAILRPVQIGGTTISRASLHNADEIKRLDVKVGDTVIIQRAGDVIPDVVSVLKEMRTGKEKEFKMPKTCPVCGSKVIRRQGEVIHRCFNLNCGAIARKSLYHFVSKRAFEIIGLGPKIINQLMAQGLISDAADIFKLKEGDLISLERFAKKSAANLVAAITKSKKIPLARLIYALGVRHVGEETALDLAQKFGSLTALKEACLEDLLLVRDVGEVVAKSIADFFREGRNSMLIKKLLANGVVIQEQKQVRQQKFLGKTFVFTGELAKLTRDEAKNKVRALGGEVSESVSTKTDFMIVGKDPGSKLKKAQQLKIKIIDEKEFLKMV